MTSHSLDPTLLGQISLRHRRKQTPVYRGLFSSATQAMDKSVSFERE